MVSGSKFPVFMGLQTGSGAKILFPKGVSYRLFQTKDLLLIRWPSCGTLVLVRWSAMDDGGLWICSGSSGLVDRFFALRIKGQSMETPSAVEQVS